MKQHTHEIPDLDLKGLRHFGLTTGAIVVVLFGLFLPWVFGFSAPLWPWIVGGVLAIWALMAPSTLKPVYNIWMRFGLVMSRITTPIILGIVFFFVVAPVGFVMRLVRHDPMARTLDPSQQSYRVESRKASKEQMEKPF